MTATPAHTEAHCNSCGGERTHHVLFREHSEWSENEGEYEGSDTYETLKCAGCGAIKLRHHATYPGEPYESTSYFPAAVFRTQPKWFRDLEFELFLENDSLPELLNEVYVALQHGMRRLAAMGVRALLERMMINKIGDQGSFKANMEAFEAKGYASRIQKERLLAILEAGHAAIHRDYNPSRDDVVILLDITEHLVETLYVHEAKVKQLQKRIPKRLPRSGV